MYVILYNIVYVNILVYIMKVTISLLGPKLDADSQGAWKPSVALARQGDLRFDRYYLLYQRRHENLKKKVVEEIAKHSPQTEVLPEEINLTDVWDFEKVYCNLFEFCRRHNFFRDDNDYYIHITTGSHVAQICLFLLAESKHLPGKLIQTYTENRSDEIGKHKIVDLSLACYDKIAQRFAEEGKTDQNILKSGIDTRNKQFNLLIENIEKVAKKSSEPILLTGPTGAGKTQLAGKIHELRVKTRKLAPTAPFICVNCATLRGDTAMSVLFGHKKGAFTGAINDHKGMLERADGGILFLDEIGELGLDEQAMLLRAIELKRFLPLGGEEEIDSNFELICGTNRDLRKAVQHGEFREDLLARINLWPFRLPGLADRREDIEPNLQYELNKFEEKNNIHVTFNQEAKNKFMSFALDPATKWPGNFRDLNAAVTRMAIMANGGRINENNVNEEIDRLRQNWTGEEEPRRLVDRLLGSACEEYDEIALCQLEKVIEICRQCNTMAEAGRKLFNRKRDQKPNYSDLMKKYLANFGLTFAECHNIHHQCRHTNKHDWSPERGQHPTHK